MTSHRPLQNILLLKLSSLVHSGAKKEASCGKRYDAVNSVCVSVCLCVCLFKVGSIYVYVHDVCMYTASMCMCSHSCMHVRAPRCLLCVQV